MPTARSIQHRTLSRAVLLVVTLAAAAAFTLPFAAAGATDSSRVVEGSLLLGVVTAGALVVALSELARQAGPGNLSRATAILGVLVAIDATLRLVPSFLGASPIFVLIILVGYVFGSAFGFTMGALTLLLSAVLTAGVGPWLPFQMICAAWVGAGAGLLPTAHMSRWQVVQLAAYGAAASFGYGALINLYSWPFAAPGTEIEQSLFWAPGLSLGETLARYARFYLTTSLIHDATRALATATLVALAGPPVVRMLRRFRLQVSWRETQTGRTLR
ncbi:MAG: ECF transporter S component [Thermomicrobiales bacterium]|nr:ECF transporter S component [Thermomicrobiales bacterium]